jgi:hypothetical protein
MARRSGRQRGALFGLDARVALVVLALLVLMVGFNALGRVKLGQQAALVGEMQAFELALAHYQADMGTFFTNTLDKAEEAPLEPEDLSVLWDKSRVLPGFQARWQGPYLARENLKNRLYGQYGLLVAQPNREPCTEESPCTLWLTLTRVPNAVWAEVNRALDEAGGKAPEAAEVKATRGKIQATGTEPERTLLYRLERGSLS